jgi:wyosine [tRNA(Phe)-imidazoG37] synthetase (radical SAM superfamily)
MARMNPNAPQGTPPIRSNHRRQWREYLYVYPVVSRRSKGLSIGVNLNNDKRCTYACVYCQVDRHIPRAPHEVNLPTLRIELEAVLAEAVSGQIWQDPGFAATPRELRRLNDIAFSGDGEPTCLENFDAAVAVAAEAKAHLGLSGVKIVVITNASQFHTPQFQATLPILDANNGEIWAKLDAGSELYFSQINRPTMGLTLARIVGDITDVARGRPIVIQSLFARLGGQEPSPEEIAAYVRRLEDIVSGGGKIQRIQVYTVARRPAEPNVGPVTNDQLHAIAQAVHQAMPQVPVEIYSATGFTAPAIPEG